MWCRCSICPTNGWRAGPICNIRLAPRCRVIFRKPGGANPPRRCSDRFHKTLESTAMILGETTPAAVHVLGHITLDELFRRAAARRPDATALIDAPNRERFTDGPAWRLSYAEADRIVSAIAARLRGMLPTDAVV